MRDATRRDVLFPGFGCPDEEAARQPGIERNPRGCRILGHADLGASLEDSRAYLDRGSWRQPRIFEHLQMVRKSFDLFQDPIDDVVARPYR